MFLVLDTESIGGGEGEGEDESGLMVLDVVEGRETCEEDGEVVEAGGKGFFNFY